MAYEEKINKAKSLRQERNDCWILGRQSLDAVVEERLGLKADILLCVSQKNGLMLGSELIEQDNSDLDIVSWTLDCIIMPKEGKPRRPSEVMLIGESFDELVPILNKLNIQVASRATSHPLLSEAAEMLTSMLSDEIDPTLTMDEDADYDLIGEFFSATAQFHRLRPWELEDGELPIKIELKQKKSVSYWPIVMGAAGMEYGLTMFRSADAIAKLYGNPDEEKARKAVRKVWSFGFSYTDIEELSKFNQAECLANDWEMAEDSAYPSALVVDPKLKEPVRMPNMNELNYAVIVIRHLNAFFEKNRKKISKQQGPVNVEQTIEINGAKSKATINYPAPEYLQLLMMQDLLSLKQPNDI